MPGTGAKPFRIDVADSVLSDLSDRLGRVRWPDEVPGDPGWSYGSDVAYLRTLVEYWRDGYDWRSWEARLNQFTHFRAPVAGIDLHFVHEEGRGPDPLPLLVCHGWPGSFFEFHRLIPLLTDPAASGGDPADAFTVVAPSLPGYGFSFRPGQPRFGVVEMAEVMAELMGGVLGHRRFGAQGGDWGAGVITRLALTHPGLLAGIHLNLLFAGPPPGSAEPSPEEAEALSRLEHWRAEESGYQWIQGTKPQTLAFALTDSPAGLAAWIVEKFRAWSDCDGDVESRFSRDELLTNVMLYWVTGAVGSSFWPYYAVRHGGSIRSRGEMVEVPAGYADFPKEILRPPRSWAEGLFKDLRRWTVMPSGGHFAALEEPEALAGEIRAFFRPLR